MVQELVNNPQIQAYSESKQGGRSENQDYCTGKAFDAHHTVLVVCDGMGGAAGGSQASFLAAHTIVDEMAAIFYDQLTEPAKKPTPEEMLEQVFQKATLAVYNRSREVPELRGMGSTAVVLYLTPEAAYFAHAGDSRGYQLRNKKKLFRTNDHSRVFELVELGVYTEEQARTAPGNNIITRAMGLKKEVDVDIVKLPYTKGDRFMLCCDGIWNTMPEAQLLAFFTNDDPMKKVVEDTTAYVDRLGAESHAEYDNLTLIGAEVAADSTYQYSLTDKICRWFAKHKKKTKPKALKPAKPTPKPAPKPLSQPAATKREENNQPADAGKEETQANND